MPPIESRPYVGLNAAELARRVPDRFLPAHLCPRIVDRLADHRRRDAVGMRGIPEGEPPLDARVAVVRVPVPVGHHAHHLFVLHFRVERAADAAIRARRRHGALRTADLDERLLGQRDSGARLDARAARHAFGGEERLVLARRDFRTEPAALNRQRQRALHFVARPHAARADDAHGGIEGEVGVARVLVRVPVVDAIEAVARLGDVELFGHVLQFAVTVRGTRHAVERVIGDVELHHAAAKLRELGALGAHLDAVGDKRRARRGIAAAPFDFHQAQTARAERLQRVGCAQLGHVLADRRGRAHDGRAVGHRDRLAVDLERDQLAFRCRVYARRPEVVVVE